jgi:ABC-type transport system involved in cytochrome c biogenesis permease subunit
VDWFKVDRHIFLLAVAIYGISMIYSVFLWRKGFRKDNRVNYLLLLAGFGMHTTAMFMRGFSINRCPINNLYEATTFVTWTTVCVYLVLGLWSRLRFLGAFASPLLFAICVFALMPDLDAPHGPKPEFTGGWLSLHVALFSLAYAAFGLGAVAGIMFLTQVNDLKLHKLRAVASLMPPVQRLELATGRLLLAGFIALTAALAVSVIWSEHLGNIKPTDPKVLWSWFVWLLYFALVVMRWKFPQGGRRFAWGSIVAFAFVLLTFWGSSLLSPLHRQ